MRLAKYLAHAGVASRRAAERLIAEGRVALRGAVVRDPALDVGPGAEVTVDGRPIGGFEPRVVYALHKPVGVLSTARDPFGRPTVVELVHSPLRLYPVGRLDRDTSGLLLLTNDGELAHRLTHPSFALPRRYRARIANPPVGSAALAALRRGVVLEDGPTAPAQVRRLAADRLEIELREGRNRQVRRMLAAVGHPVEALERVGFGPLALGELRPGAYRRLSGREVELLAAATVQSRQPNRR